MSEPIHLPGLNDSLKERLLKWLPEQSRLETPISGLALTRHDENTSAIKCFYTPMIALVVQGFKRSMIGDHEANYGELHCVTVGIDMPGVFHITDASPQAPFLSLSVKLDRRIITQLITEAPSIVTVQEGEVTPIVVDEVGKDLLQAFSRLVERNTGKSDRSSYLLATGKLHVTASNGRTGSVCQHGSLDVQSAF